MPERGVRRDTAGGASRYRLADSLLRAGFNATDTGKILGGNYLRVFESCTV
jgi:microsomal dipeptidase-like Zn-dependent dipeptidase